MHVPETYTQAQLYFLPFILLLVAPSSPFVVYSIVLALPMVTQSPKIS